MAFSDISIKPQYVFYLFFCFIAYADIVYVHPGPGMDISAIFLVFKGG